MNTIIVILGSILTIVFGMILGFWIEILFIPELPRDMKSCHDCGPSFAEVERVWQKYNSPTKK